MNISMNKNLAASGLWLGQPTKDVMVSGLIGITGALALVGIGKLGNMYNNHIVEQNTNADKAGRDEREPYWTMLNEKLNKKN